MDLLIDVNVALDYCAKRQPCFAAARDAIELCRFGGGRLWLYVGSVQTLEYNLCAELRRDALAKDENHTTRQIASRSRTLLKDFSRDKHWLAALADEGPVFEEADPEDEQLIRSLARFAPGSIKLLTRDQPLLDAHPDQTITPTRYCQQSTEANKLDFMDLKAQQDVVRGAVERNLHRVLEPSPAMGKMS